MIQQLSTMPSWLYVDGTDPKTLNPDPWQYNGFADYNHGEPHRFLCALSDLLNGALMVRDEAKGRVVQADGCVHVSPRLPLHRWWASRRLRTLAPKRLQLLMGWPLRPQRE